MFVNSKKKHVFYFHFEDIAILALYYLPICVNFSVSLIWRLCCVGFVCMLGQVLKVLNGHTDWVLDVAISVGGGKIVSGSHDKTVRVWSMETGEVCMVAV